jgi:hypothetical protein
VAILNVHRSKSDFHERLGFHPDCPVCRQDRLSAVLSPEPNWPRRVRALLAAGVLVLSAGATTTSVASEPDNQQEGVVVPDPGAVAPDSQPDGQEPGDQLDPDAGGESTLPLEIDPRQSDPPDGAPGDGSADTGPLEAEPLDDPDGRLSLTEPGAPDDLGVEVPPVPPAEPAPPATPLPPAEAPVAEQTPADQTQPAEGSPRRRPPKRSGRENERARPKHRSADQPSVDRSQDKVPAAEESAPYASPTDAQLDGVVPAPSTTPPPGLGRFHVVRPGESLWSIASELLGRDAPPAEIALEVGRLWLLNKERIASGDPDLLAIGVRLRLR